MPQCPPLMAVPLSSISTTVDQATTWCGDEPARGLAANNRFTLQLEDGTRVQVRVCLSVSGKVGLRHSSMKPSASEPATPFGIRAWPQLQKPTALRPSAHREPPSTTARTSTAHCRPTIADLRQPPLAASPKDLPPARPALACISARTICKPADIGRWLSASTRSGAMRWAVASSRHRSRDAAGVDRA